MCNSFYPVMASTADKAVGGAINFVDWYKKNKDRILANESPDATGAKGLVHTVMVTEVVEVGMEDFRYGENVLKSLKLLLTGLPE